MKISVLVAGFLGFATVNLGAHAEVTVKDAWVRATSGSGRITAGYGLIINSGPTNDELIGVGTPAAGTAQLHNSVNRGGVMSMEPVEVLSILADKQVRLAPGGYHLMISDLRQPLEIHDTMQLTFRFRYQGVVTVTAKVMPLSYVPGPSQ